MSQEYPKYKYHAKEPATIVHNPEEEKALGKGWHDQQVKGNTAVDPAAGIEQSDNLQVSGDDAFETFLVDKGFNTESDDVIAMLRVAYDFKPSHGTTPMIEYGHPVGPQDSVTMVDDETARKALLKQAKDMGITVHHLSSSKTIQAKIDEFNSTKSSTPAALPKDVDVDADQE